MKPGPCVQAPFRHRYCFISIGLAPVSKKKKDISNPRRCLRRGLCDSMWNINTDWNTCEIQVERFWECSTSVFILLIYNCFVFFRNPASTLFFINTKQMSFFFLFRSKCYDIVYYNCKLKLWTFKAGSKNKLSFNKIHFIHLTKESCKHYNFPHLKWFNNAECYRDWLLQMQISVCSG